LVLAAAVAHVKDQRAQESGTLLQMNSVEYGTDQKSGKSFAHQKTHLLLCQEYRMQTDRIISAFAQRTISIPFSCGKAQFRMDKGK
jgi:hypothetical protein